jgi:hypothetical protein
VSNPRELPFALRFVDGKGVLGLGEKLPLSLVDVDRLELRVPNLRFPFDVSGGVARFQSRRCDFGAAELRVDEARLQAWLDSRTRLGRLGLSGLRARLCAGRIELSARARVGENTAPLTARVTLEPAGGKKVVLEQTGGALHFAGAAADAAATARAAAVREALVDMTALGAVSAGAPGKGEGLDRPALVLTVDLDGGKPRRFRFGARDDFHGSPAYDARRDGVDATFAVAEALVRPLLEAAGAGKGK